MLRNYIKVAFRNLWRHRIFSAINIFGLAIGIAACLLIMLYVDFELSYDNFHEKADRIYRVKHESFKDGKLVEASASTFPAVGPDIKAAFPEVEDATSIYAFECIVSAADTDRQKASFKEKGVYFVDSSFLKVFTFPLLKGSLKAMNALNSVIITEQTARKYFGEEDPIGKSIQLENHNQGLLLTATVRGVCVDIPANSHLQFNFLVSTFRGGGPWLHPNLHTYLLLSPEASVRALEEKLPALVEKHTGQQQNRLISKLSLSLQPLKSIHLYSDLKREISRNGDAKMIWILALSALLILVIAYINYINLSIAKSMERAKEVGIRKVLGSERLQLVKQFFLEAMLSKIISIALAVLIVAESLEWFKRLSGISHSFAHFNSPWYWLGFLGVFIAGAALSGLYPALVMSSFQPLKVLKGQASRSNKGLTLRKALIVFQFAISILLMIGAFTVYRQVTYMRTKDLGIDMSNTLVVAAPEYRRESQQDEMMFYQKITTFKNEVTRFAGVSSLTFTSGIPGTDLNWSRPYKRKNYEEASKDETLYATMSVDPDFVEQLKVSVVEGEKFSMESAMSLYRKTQRIPVMINEAAVEAMGFDNAKAAIGQIITDKNGMGKVFEYEIIGVTRNFHQSSLKTAYTPIVFRPEDGSGMAYFVVKVAPERISEVIMSTENAYKTLFPGTPYHHFFLDDFFDQQYIAEQQFGKVFGLFTAFAIFVACMGLLGLMLLTTAQRSKEIAIRKVIGAPNVSLFVLLSKDFSKLILIATFISLPLGWWGINQWLENYAFHIDADASLLLIPACVVFIVALLSISFMILRAANTNPIKAIRYD